MRIALENLTERQSFQTERDWIDWPAIERAGIRMAKRGGTVTVSEITYNGMYRHEIARPIGHITDGGFQPIEPSCVQ